MAKPVVTSPATLLLNGRPHGHLVWVNGWGWAEQVGFTIYLT